MRRSAPLPRDHSQHDVEQHPHLHKAERRDKLAFGFPSAGQADAAGRAGQQRQRQNRQQIPPLEAIDRLIGCVANNIREYLNNL